MEFLFQKEDLTTNSILNVFDMSKNDSTATKEDHGFIRFSYNVDDCAVNVSMRVREGRQTDGRTDRQTDRQV